MRHLLTLAVLALAVTLPARSFAADWPQFLGPSANAIAPDTGINKDWAQKPPKELWRVALTDNGFAGPSVADGKVFIIDHQGDQDIVRALDLQTGNEVWRATYTDARGDNYGFSRSTPVYDQGKVYTLSRMGNLHCYDARTGTNLWAKNLITDFGGKKISWEYAMSPLIDGEKIIVCPGGQDAAVAAVNKANGALIWKGGGSDIAGYATPVLATIQGKRQYVVFTGVSLIGVSDKDGQLLWRHPFPAAHNVNAATPRVSGDYILIGNGYGSGRTALLQVTADGVKEQWVNPKIQPKFSTQITHGGHLYSTSERSVLFCAEIKTGAEKWAQPGFEYGGMVAVDGVLIVLDGRSGELVMVNLTPDAYQERGRIKPLGGQSWTAPIVAHGKLLVRNKTALVCLDLK